MLRPVKKPITVIPVPLLSAGCTAVRNAADGMQRNFRLRQSEYGPSLKDGLILK